MLQLPHNGFLHYGDKVHRAPLSVATVVVPAASDTKCSVITLGADRLHNDIYSIMMMMLAIFMTILL